MSRIRILISLSISFIDDTHAVSMAVCWARSLLVLIIAMRARAHFFSHSFQINVDWEAENERKNIGVTF